MKKEEENEADELLPEYNFDYSKAIWGMFASEGRPRRSNAVVLKSEIAQVFPDSDSVNAALRGLIEISRRVTPVKAKRPRKSAKAQVHPIQTDPV